MMKKAVAVASLLCSASVSAMSLKSSLLVHSPQSLVHRDGYDHTVGHFGEPSQMGGLTLPVFYSTEQCGHIDTSKGYPNVTAAGGTIFQAPYILLLDRSDECDFVRQARVAQHAGASAVVIMDHLCVCEDTECQPEKPCQAIPPILPDDGSAGDITIPTMLVPKQTADKFKQTMTIQNKGILMEMRFDYYKVKDDGSEKVPYHIWTTPTDSVSRYLLSQFGPLESAFHEHAQLVPHSYLHSGRGYLNCGSPDSDGDAGALCNELCTNQGRYCATTDFRMNVTGAEIVAESLRRLCIVENYKHNGHVKAYWIYVALHQHECYHKDGQFSNPACIDKAFHQAGVDRKVIEECIAKSGGTEGTEPNTMLDQELLAQKEYGIYRHPAVVVAKRQLTGPPMGVEVLQALCDELDWRLPVCHACAQCYGDVAGCIEFGSCKAAHRKEEEYERKHRHDGHGGGHPFWHFIKWCFILGILGGGGYAAWIYSHRNSAVGNTNFGRGLLTDYMNLSNQDDSQQSMGF